MLIDFDQRTVQSKIVFYGCAMSGKSTALQGLYRQLDGAQPIISIETSHAENSRTLYYDYGPLKLKFGAWNLQLNFWTATGQDFYCVTRPTVLQRTDGILFVVDSQLALTEFNKKSWDELKSFFGARLERIVPVIVCLNKRDLPDPVSAEVVRQVLPLRAQTPLYETIATKNINLFPAFKQLLDLVFQVHKVAKTSIMDQLK